MTGMLRLMVSVSIQGFLEIITGARCVVGDHFMGITVILLLRQWHFPKTLQKEKSLGLFNSYHLISLHARIYWLIERAKQPNMNTKHCTLKEVLLNLFRKQSTSKPSKRFHLQLRQKSRRIISNCSELGTQWNRIESINVQLQYWTKFAAKGLEPSH
jgi:hypothetical protein